MQFNLKWLLATVAFVAFGCVALYNANLAWAEATMGLTVFVLLSAVLGSIYFRPRGFFIGICVFGWGYLLLTYAPMRTNPPTLTDTLLEFLHSAMQMEAVFLPEAIVSFNSVTINVGSLLPGPPPPVGGDGLVIDDAAVGRFGAAPSVDEIPCRLLH